MRSNAVLGGCGWAERRCGRERRRGVQKPLAACQGKTVPGAVQLVTLGRSVPGGPPRPPVVGNPGSVRRRAGGPEPRRRCRIRAWFESEGRHLVADAQREVVKGAADDGVGTVVQQLERRYVEGYLWAFRREECCHGPAAAAVAAEAASSGVWDVHSALQRWIISSVVSKDRMLIRALMWRGSLRRKRATCASFSVAGCRVVRLSHSTEGLVSPLHIG
jgi:hypothetical protein